MAREGREGREGEGGEGGGGRGGRGSTRETRETHKMVLPWTEGEQEARGSLRIPRPARLGAGNRRRGKCIHLQLHHSYKSGDVDTRANGVYPISCELTGVYPITCSL